MAPVPSLTASTNASRYRWMDVSEMTLRKGKKAPHGRSASHHALQINSTSVKASRSSRAYRKERDLRNTHFDANAVR